MLPELLSDSLFPILLTLGAFFVGQWCQRRWRSPLCNPILIAVLLVIAALGAMDVPNSQYQSGCAAFSWLLTPATVCLAVPLYRQMQTLRRCLPALCAGTAAGAAACLITVLLFARLFHFERPLTVSLLPKSITTAMGIALSELNGGIPAVTTAAIVSTGILGSLLGPFFVRLFRLTDPVAQGAAFGTAAHVIGTSKASELSELTGAVSSLSLVLAGILTAVFLPLAIRFL